MDGRPDWPERGGLEFKNVSLRYREGTETVLDGLSFKVGPGKKVGIVGRTGAGKSTISVAISRIVEIFGGEILIDDLNIQKIPLDHLRRKVTIIP